MPNPSGNDFRQARKRQTLRETTFAKRGNAKPLGKRLSPCAEMSNHSGNDFRHARKCQTIREMTFAVRGKSSFWPFCSVQQREKLHFGLFAVCRSVVFMFRRPTTGFFSQLLVDRRRAYFMNFLLYLSYLHPMDCRQTPLRQRRGHA